MRARIIVLSVSVVACVASGWLGVGAAWGAAGWWHLTTSARPTALQSGVGKTEIQQITIDATQGLVLLKNPQLAEEARIFVVNSAAATLEEQLGELYGAGNVEVTGGPLVTGTGNVIGPVTATGKLTSGSATVEEVSSEAASGLVVGQVIEGSGIPAGTTILAVEGETITLSANATESASGVALTGVPSKIVTNVASSSGTFAVGQELSASGIAVGTKIEAIGAGTLTLSQAPTAVGGTGINVGVLAPYTLTFKGGLVGRPLPLLEEIGLALAGGKAEARVSEISKGASDGQVVVSAANLGEVPISGSLTPVHVVDDLPAGLEAVSIEANVWESEAKATCVLATVSCTFNGAVSPFELIEMRVGVKVAPGTPSEVLNEATVAGGEVPEVSLKRNLRVGGSVPFGVDEYDVAFENAGGSLDTQAGAHPFQMTTTVGLTVDAAGEPVNLPKEVNVAYPTGFIGNPTPFTQCTLKQFLREVSEGEHLGGGNNECPASSAIGVAEATVNEPSGLGVRTLMAPVFNIEPSVGEPARFGFLLPGTPVFVDISVRTGGDYGITAHVRNISQVAGLLRSEVTIWGVPGLAAHHNSRGSGCLEVTRGKKNHLPCNVLEEAAPPAFLSLPTSCEGPMQSSIEAASWEGADVFTVRAADPMQALDGCNQLAFEPSITVTPDDQRGSSPTGLTVGVHVPQETSLTATGRAEGEVKDATVALPPGVVVNPAVAGGLSACLEGQIGLQSPTAAQCPESAKVATVEVKTPVLPNPLRGAAYVAAQNANPFGSLAAIYVFAEDPVSGVRIKLAGEVNLDPTTGQLTTTFANTPQAPFEDFTIHFFGGARAPLGTPGLCGNYTTNATFAPWSGNASVSASSTFAITSGPNGVPCANPLPFTPSVAAGSTNLQAGGLTPFTTTISRGDGQQNLRALRLRTPPGLSGLLSNVALCGEAQANVGTCPAASLIGETTVSVGLGGSPFSVTGGKVYITGPYHGAPFGLAIVNPAKAGPYDLGQGACDCIIVRATIQVDRHTAELTITTDSEGPYKIPSVLDGIPLQIQHVNATINHHAFTFNPTNCNPMQITGALTSTQGTTAPISVPFQVTNCAALKFTPKFTFTTNGRTSKRNGASLTTKVVYPPTRPGTEANLAKVKVTLPKQLPSRLTTLQKACLAKTFEQNPASCPRGSIIGHAVVHTPLVPVPLTGPAYFVSHGSEAFPSLTVLLQGYGVTDELIGQTHISRQGITSGTFSAVPDVPFSSFELILPQGPGSALAANGNLCKTKLTIPTIVTSQSNIQIAQNIPIRTINCRKHANKHHKHAVKHRKHK